MSPSPGPGDGGAVVRVWMHGGLCVLCGAIAVLSAMSGDSVGAAFNGLFAVANMAIAVFAALNTLTAAPTGPEPKERRDV